MYLYPLFVVIDGRNRIHTGQERNGIFWSAYKTFDKKLRNIQTYGFGIFKWLFGNVSILRYKCPLMKRRCDVYWKSTLCVNSDNWLMSNDTLIKVFRLCYYDYTAELHDVCVLYLGPQQWIYYGRSGSTASNRI